MADPLENIADAIVTHLNAILSPSLVFKAEKPDVLKLERESADLAVHVIPFSKRREKQARSAVLLVTYEVNVLITRGLEDGVTRETMTAFRTELEEALDFQKMSGVTWSETELVVPYDVQHKTEFDQFTSLIRPTYTELIKV